MHCLLDLKDSVAVTSRGLSSDILHATHAFIGVLNRFSVQRSVQGNA